VTEIEIHNLFDKNHKLEEENKNLKTKYENISLLMEDKNDKIFELNSIIENKDSDLLLKDN